MRDDNNHLSKLGYLKVPLPGSGCDENANGGITARLTRGPEGSEVREIMGIYDVDGTRELRLKYIDN